MNNEKPYRTLNPSPLISIYVDRVVELIFATALCSEAETAIPEAACYMRSFQDIWTRTIFSDPEDKDFRILQFLDTAQTSGMPLSSLNQDRDWPTACDTRSIWW